MTLTPQQKAVELADRFISLGRAISISKQCAIICVDEILSSVPIQPSLS